MANLCDTCRKRWCKCEGVECRLTQSIYKTMAAMRHEADAPVTSCSRYDQMAIIEREDDGTQRCSCCGALWRGWMVCPNCGADWRSKEAHKAAEDEVVRIVTAEITEVSKGEEATALIEGDAEPNHGWYYQKLKAAFPDADNINIAKIQQFITKEANDEQQS